jgi:hypothetical protein
MLLIWEAIRVAAIAAAIFIGSALVTGLISANVRQLASAKGWDTHLLWLWDRVLPTAAKFAGLRVTWLCLGLSAGLAIAFSLPVSNPLSIVSPPSPPQSIIINAALTEGGTSTTPLALTGTFATGGKSLKFVIDLSIDTIGRGKALRHVPRMKIGEVRDFFKGQAVNVVVVSYFNEERTVPMWGPQHPLSGVNDETFQFTSFVKASIFAIDDTGHETRIIGFTLLPKMDFMEFNAAVMEFNTRFAVNSLSHNPDQREPFPKVSWRNLIVFRDGALESIDSLQ